MASLAEQGFLDEYDGFAPPEAVPQWWRELPGPEHEEMAVVGEECGVGAGYGVMACTEPYGCVS